MALKGRSEQKKCASTSVPQSREAPPLLEMSISMAIGKFIVRFNEHVAAKQVASMATGIAAYGNVLPGSSDLEFVVEVFRASKAPGLKVLPAQWEVHGFLNWDEGNSN
jgi:hypothetical protein